jgi:hypothetical protein
MEKALIRPNEKCRGFNLPKPRQQEIRLAAAKIGMTMAQAFSFRRLLIRLRAGKKRRSSASLGLGTEQEAKILADSAEQVVKQFLMRNRIGFLDEKAQKKKDPHNNTPTPDFILKTPCRINGQIVHWIEVKSYYATASITSKDHFMGLGRSVNN